MTEESKRMSSHDFDGLLKYIDQNLPDLSILNVSQALLIQCMYGLAELGKDRGLTDPEVQTSLATLLVRFVESTTESYEATVSHNLKPEEVN